MDAPVTQLYSAPQSSGSSYAMLIILDGDGRAPKAVELNPKRALSFGRKEAGLPEPNIPLQSEVVSHGQHGAFRFENGDWIYSERPDVTNRAYINGVHAPSNASLHLKNGDVLRIDNMQSPMPNALWILFSTVKIRGQWRKEPLAKGKETTIGRVNCNINIPIPYVSALHAVIREQNSQYLLIDKNSRNGTWCNRRRVKRELLKEKDWFSIGECHFILINGNLLYNIPDNSSPPDGDCVLLKADIASKKVKSKNGGKKELLRNIHIEIKQGTLVALLGGSGAGKTTLMNCLNGFDYSGVEGNVTFNGENLYDNFERLKVKIGSVPQQVEAPSYRPTQTVGAEFRYDATLRLPGDYSQEGIDERVETTEKKLNLQQKDKTPIKDLSGGEKRRVSIGVELVADRELLCLDEPDAGLDPLSKMELIDSLRELAVKDKKTILVIIHDIAGIDSFHQVIMLLKDKTETGRLAFSGTPEEARNYFFQRSQSDAKSGPLKSPDNALMEAYRLVKENPEHYIAGDAVSPSARRPARTGNKKTRQHISWRKEFFLSIRQFCGLLFGNQMGLLTSIGFAAATALIMWGVAGENLYRHYEGTQSACFLLVSAAIWCGLFNSITLIVRERAVVRLEYNAGRRLGCYIFSQAFVQMWLCLTQSAIMTFGGFALIERFFDNPPPESGILLSALWPEYFISVFLVMFAADCMGIMISGLVTSLIIEMEKRNKRVDESLANTLAPYLLIVQLVFAGILFPLNGVLDKVSCFTLSRWGMEAIGSGSLINDRPMRIQLELENLPIPPKDPSDMFLSTDAHLIRTWAFLFAFSAAFLILTTMALRRAFRDKR